MKFHLRNVTILIGAFVFTPFAWLVLFSNSDLNENTLLEQRLAELRDRLHYAESLNQERENDVHILRNQIKVLVGAHTHGNSSVTGNVVIPREARELLMNLSQSASGDISPPGMYNYLPHLLNKPNGLRPGFKLSQGRIGVSIVMGVPTIKRDRESYLMQTLQSLIENLNEVEKEDCVIIVFVAEPNDLTYTKEVANQVQEKFGEYVQSGLVEVISPSSDFYPNFDNLRETFGDPIERVRWRTKQNLDFSYLMMYARSKGTYYLQLEDDVITKPGYLNTMKSFAIQQKVDDWILLEYSKLGFIDYDLWKPDRKANHLEDDIVTKPGYITLMKNFALNQKSDEWVLLEFSYLGFIGKMFKSRDLPLVVEFFLMFHRDKPIDWLLDHLLYVKVCNPEKDRWHCFISMQEQKRIYKPDLFQVLDTYRVRTEEAPPCNDDKHCQHSIGELRRRFKPSLFQHIGLHSSLPGKVQKLKDKDFGKNLQMRGHINPNADVSTTLKTYQHFSLDRAYLGEKYFWGLLPQAGDTISFRFNPPILIEKYLFRSGNAEHPGDRFFNTSVEVLSTEHLEKDGGILNNDVHEHGVQRTDDGFLIINKFDHDSGIATGAVDKTLGTIDTLRLRVLSESESWVILSEILIQPKAKT